MKTIKQWFESVADTELRGLLIENMNPEKATIKQPSLSFAIAMGFIWGDYKTVPAPSKYYYSDAKGGGTKGWRTVFDMASKGDIPMIADVTNAVASKNPFTGAFYNTTSESGPDLKAATMLADKQDNILKEYFSKHDDYFSASMLYNNRVLGTLVPITSYRRSLNTLFKSGVIERGPKIIGMFGRKEFTYKFA